MSDLGGTDQDADTDVTITSTRDEDEDGDGVLSPRQDKGDGGESEPSNKTLFGSPGPSGTSGTVGVGAGVQSNADATKTPSPTRGIRGSFVWNYFRREYDETGINTIKGICKTCKTPIRVQKGSTTAMRNHLANKHPELHNEMLKNEEKNDKENV